MNIQVNNENVSITTDNFEIDASSSNDDVEVKEVRTRKDPLALIDELCAEIKVLSERADNNQTCYVSEMAKNQRFEDQLKEIWESRLGSIDLYQEQTARTDSPKTHDDAVTNYCFGLVGEVGEVVDSIKKQRYQGHSDEATRAKIIDEMGDVMWYMCRLATAYNIYMSEVLVRNVEKLRKRYPNGFSVKDSVERETEE